MQNTQHIYFILYLLCIYSVSRLDSTEHTTTHEIPPLINGGNCMQKLEIRLLVHAFSSIILSTRIKDQNWIRNVTQLWSTHRGPDAAGCRPSCGPRTGHCAAARAPRSHRGHGAPRSDQLQWGWLLFIVALLSTYLSTYLYRVNTHFLSTPRSWWLLAGSTQQGTRIKLFFFGFSPLHLCHVWFVRS